MLKIYGTTDELSSIMERLVLEEHPGVPGLHTMADGTYVLLKEVNRDDLEARAISNDESFVDFHADGALLGMLESFDTDEARLVYDRTAFIAEMVLSGKPDMTYEDAEEFYNFNTIGLGMKNPSPPVFVD